VSIKDILLAIMLWSCWAANFVVIKLGVTYIPPIWLMAARFLLVGLVLFPWLFKIRREQWPHLLGLCISLGVFYFGLLGIGSSKITASMLTLIMQLSPPLAALIAGWVLKEKPKPIVYCGMALALVGVLIVVGIPEGHESWLGVSCILMAAFLWAASSTQIRLLKGIHPMTLNAAIAVISFPFLVGLGAWLEPSYLHHFRLPPWQGWFALLYMAGVSTLLCYTLWFRLLHRNPVNRVVSFALLQPPVALLCAYLFLGEPLHASLWIGGVFCLAGVGLVVLRR
jgi:O-acetylserine/cysteine efflux transporter